MFWIFKGLPEIRLVVSYAENVVLEDFGCFLFCVCCVKIVTGVVASIYFELHVDKFVCNYAFWG